jgi:ribosome-binding factor A
MKEFDRTERIGAELKRELYQVLRDEVRDPRLAHLTIQEVRVVKDLSHAKVFFTCLPATGDDIDAGEEQGVAQTRLLNGRLAGFLRHALAQRVRLRTMPELHFVYDESIRTGMHLSSLIDHAIEGIANPADTGPEFSQEFSQEPSEAGPQTTQETPR